MLQALASNELPDFDAALRSRSQFAVSMMEKLHGDTPVAQARLTARVLLDFVFRYPGLPHVITDTLLETSFLEDTRNLFSEGFTTHNGELLIDYVRQRLLFFLELRTEVSVMFARGDGRPQLVRGRHVQWDPPNR